MAEVLFWLSFGAIIYTYAGYPVAICLLARLRRRLVRKGDHVPSVSLIVPAYNEEAVIGAKVANGLSLEYPPERLEVIVVSDGSDDRTEDIVKGYAADPRVRLLVMPGRGGKAGALNAGAQAACGEVLVFSDANVELEKGAVRELARNFADPAVGCVCGRVRVGEGGERSELSGESFHVRYEQFLHRCESLVDSMVSIDGALYAIRRELFTPLREDTITDDLVISMKPLARGWRTIYEPLALGWEGATESVAAEVERKARIVAGGYQALTLLPHLLSPFGRPLVFFEFASHKLLRWLAPFFMAAALLANAALAARPLYGALLVGQVLFYGVALAAWAWPALRRSFITYLPYYFCGMNWAAAKGLQRFVLGAQSATWKRTERLSERA